MAFVVAGSSNINGMKWKKYWNDFTQMFLFTVRPCGGIAVDSSVGSRASIKIEKRMM